MRFLKTLMAFILAIFPSFALASVGRIVKAAGQVSIVRSGTFRGIPYKELGGVLNVGDTVRTKKKSFADIKFIDGSFVHLDQSSRLKIIRYIPKGSVELGVPNGRVIFKVTKRVEGEFTVKTPIALIGVKGTEFEVNASMKQTVVKVFSGVVDVVNVKFPEIHELLKKGEAARVLPDMPPIKISHPVKLTPELERKARKNQRALKGMQKQPATSKPNKPNAPLASEKPKAERAVLTHQPQAQPQTQSQTVKPSHKSTTSVNPQNRAKRVRIRRRFHVRHIR